MHIGELPRGVVWVLAEAPGLARTSTQLALDGSERTAEVTLLAASALAVTVTDEEGTPLNHATVLVTAADPLPFGALTSAEGIARFLRVGPSPWTVKASARGYESVTRSGVTGDTTLALRRLGSLTVRVELPSGKPAVGATVVIAGSGLWPARRTETDVSGDARVSGLVAGNYDVKASLGNLVSDTVFGIALERGDDTSITVQLMAGRTVVALVTDGEEDDAQGVADADVVLVEGGVSSFPLRGRTGSDGRVELGPIGPGPATLSASAEGFVAASPVLVPEPLENPVRIPLLKGATLEGEVVDTKDRPVDGATVEVIGTDMHGLPIAETPMTAALRRAHFDWALPGPQPLIPAGELGVMPGPIPPIPQAWDSTGGVDDWALAPGPSPFELSDNVEQWVTLLDGTFKASPVTPGRVRALVRHPAYVEGVSELVTLAPGGSAKVKVVLLSGGTLEGKVVDASGRAVSGARVDLTAVQGTLERTTITAGDGSFAFAAVPEQVILGVARPDDLSRIVVRKTVDVTEGERSTVEIELPEKRDALRIVIRDEDGQPLDAAQVTVTSLESGSPLRQTAFTTDNGVVSIDDARGMQLAITVEVPGFARTTRQVQNAPEEIVIELSRGVMVAGRVTSVHGRQYLEGAMVTVVSEGRRLVGRTDAEGRYRIKDVSPGAVHVVVSHPELATAELDATVERTGRADRAFELPDVDLTEAATVEGEVVDAKGNPVSGARVGVGMVPAYLPTGALPAGMVVTDIKGHFSLSGVSPGKVTLSAYAPDVGRGSASAEVSAGRPTTGVRIRLSEREPDDDPTVGGSIAITLGERGSGDDVEVVVVQVAAGSEAERAGLRPGDVIYAVDGVDVTGMRDARARLSGRPGSDVVIELSRGAVRVTREQVRR